MEGAWLWTLYVFTQLGGGVDEPVRRLERRLFTRGIENTDMTDLSVVYKLYKTPVKTTFRVGVFIDIWSMVTAVGFVKRSAVGELFRALEGG
jgi:hypothetical protein